MRDFAAHRAANPTPLEAARSLIGRAPNLFRANGIAPVPLVAETRSRRLVKRLLRTVEEEAVTVRVLGDCWVVGAVPWRVPDETMRGRMANRTTALVGTAIASDVRPGAIVQVHAKNDGTVVYGTSIGWEGDTRDGRGATCWEILADRIREKLPAGADTADT